MNKFLVSTANAIGRDATTGVALFYGTTNITSALNITTQVTDVRGGIGNELIYTYYHDRAVEVNIDSATFSREFLALNSGTTVSTGAITVLNTEAVVLSGGVGTVTETPTNIVSVLLPNGTIQAITAVGTSITVSGGADQTVTAIYEYTSSSGTDLVRGYTTRPPSGINLTLIAEVRQKDNNALVEYLQVEVPNFNLSGNYSLSLAANGVSTETMQGMALAKEDPAGNFYFDCKWVPASSTSVSVSSIAATPTTFEFNSGDLPDTGQINVLGIRGELYSNVNITTSCSYVRTSGCTGFTVGATTGLITAGSSLNAGNTSVIGITYYDSYSGSLTDTVNCSVT